MDEFIFYLLLLLIPVLTIGIPVLLTYWIYRIMKKKGIDKKWRILAFIPILIVGYFIYDAFYPSDKFYEQDFEQATGVKLTEKANFHYKTASYPDHFGDYNSVSIINVGTDFYENLIIKLSENGHTENGQKIGCNEMDNAKANLSGLKIEREFSKEDGDKFFYVAFLSDKQSILVQRSSH